MVSTEPAAGQQSGEIPNEVVSLISLIEKFAKENVT
jgi:hypothetical protein